MPAGRPRVYGCVQQRACPACSAWIGNGGKTGLCASCAQIKTARAKNRERESEGGWVALSDGRLRRAATCHPEEPSFSKGLCMKCRHLATYAKTRDKARARKVELKRLRAEAEGRIFKSRGPKLPAKPCKACGKPMANQAMTYCSDECRPVKVPRTCSHCAGPMPKDRSGKTCSAACAKALHERLCPRTSKKDNSGYKGKDKQAIIERLYIEQQGRCPVCDSEGEVKNKANPKGLLVLDHDHTTRKARLLLCGRCNAALGMMLECPTRIKGLLAYAEIVCKCA